MSQENVEVVRRAVEAFNEGGMSSRATLDFFDVAAVFEEPPEQPGASTAHGRESLERMFTQFDEAWEEHLSTPDEIRPIDAERVLMFSVDRFRGRDKLEVTQPSATIFTLRDGKIVRMQSFWERENALKALGLQE
jgi:ketosteroid isomerase-like protein